MNNELTTVAEEALDELRGRFLTFYIDDTFYSIELCHIIEIISIQPTTYVPGLLQGHYQPPGQGSPGH